MKKSKLNPTTLRTILTIIIILLIGLSSAGFYYGQTWLRTLAVSVSHTVADSKTGGNSIQAMQKLQQDLLAQQSIANKADSLVASSQNYQNQAIQDLDTYAAQAGISILNYSFVQPTAAPVAAGGTAQTTASTGSTSVTVTISSPVSYVKLLKFMTSIESNLPKMQVSSVNLSRDNGGASDAVTTNQLVIEVYTK